MADEPTHRRREGVLHRHLTDGVLVLAPGAPQATALLGTAADLWDALASPATAAEITEALSARYHDHGGAMAADVRAALAQLVAAGLVEVDP